MKGSITVRVPQDGFVDDSLVLRQVKEHTRPTGELEWAAITDLPLERGAAQPVNARADTRSIRIEPDSAQFAGDTRNLMEDAAKLSFGVPAIGKQRDIEIL